jgi:DNA polymerase III gamma/tau subunit
MSFRDIYGHEKKIEIIQKTLAKKRIGHAYLFSGISAVGKRTFASGIYQGSQLREGGFSL